MFVCVPPSLVADAGSVADQQDHLVSSCVFVGRRRIHRPLHERRGARAVIAILQVVLIKVCKKAPCENKRGFSDAKEVLIFSCLIRSVALFIQKEVWG